MAKAEEKLTMPSDGSQISFGIAGWSYPDWKGNVYPAGVRDQLGYIAGYVDLIEINSTFYRPPSSRDAVSWVKRTAAIEKFGFCAKLHQDVTHNCLVEPAMVRLFHEGLKPLVENGKLRHLLAQFKFDYDDTRDHRRHLASIRDSFGDMANITFELRHDSWQGADALSFLGSMGITVANLDYPMAARSFSLRECLVGKHRYLRLHGRNRIAWFSKTAGRDQKYDYHYSDAELQDIAKRAVGLAESSSSLTVVANNHFQGKEVANILKLKAMILGTKLPVPPGLKIKYPELNEIDASA